MERSARRKLAQLKKPQLIVPTTYETDIRQDQRRLDAKEHNWKIDKLQAMYTALSDLEVTITQVDYTVLVATRHDMILKGLRDKEALLGAAFLRVQTLARALVNEAAIADLQPDVAARAENVSQVVAILSREGIMDKSRAKERTQAIRPYMHQLKEIARNASETREQIADARDRLHVGGRVGGMAAWRIVLAQTWQQYRPEPYSKGGEFEHRVRILIEKLRDRKIARTLSDDNRLKAIEFLDLVSTDPQELNKRLSNLVGEYVKASSLETSFQ